MKFILLLLSVAIVTVGAFLAGLWYGKTMADSELSPSVVLREDMSILNEEGVPKGRLPAGTRIYLVPDPTANRTTTFKLYLQTDASSDRSLRRDNGEPMLSPYGLISLSGTPTPSPSQ